LVPPVVERPVFAIRKRAALIFSLADYVRAGMLRRDQQAALEQALAERANILVVGGTGSGKTTFANALIKGISRLCPGDRLVIIEDTAEIQCQADNALFLHTSAAVDMLALLRASLRLRPDRILVGEARTWQPVNLRSDGRLDALVRPYSSSLLVAADRPSNDRETRESE